MTNQHFNEYKSKLTFEAILRSALCGIAIGFGLGLLLGLIFWLVGVDLFWILIVATIAVAAASGVLFYLFRFRPNDLSNARRLDSLGLEERLITMVELDGQDSFMAKIQREDAKISLSRIDKKQLKIKISRRIIALAASAFVLGTGIVTVNVLAHYGFIRFGSEIIEEIIEDEFTEYVTVEYEADDGGTIDGDDVQDIVKGTSTTTVTAIADEGYMFKEWSDGVVTPTRFDQKVNESITYTAIFTELEDEEGEEGEKGNGGDSDQQGQPGGSSEEEGGEGAPPGQGEPNPNATAGGGQREPNNQVIDGNTFYKEVLEEYQDRAAEQIKDNGALTDEEIELIKQYLGIV